METMMKRLISVAALALLGCGGGGDTTEPNDVVTGKASITLSGAQTGNFTSGVMAVVWSTSDNRGAFGFSVAQTTGTTTTPSIAVAMTFTGEPKVGHFKSTDVGAQGGLSVTLGQSNFWVASDANTSTPFGSYDLNLTSVTVTSTVVTGKIYKVTGTLDASLPAVAGSGTTGTVTMHATF
jgi:hypothetical protein